MIIFSEIAIEAMAGIFINMENSFWVV